MSATCQKHQPVNFNINAIAPGHGVQARVRRSAERGLQLRGADHAPRTAIRCPGSNTVDPLVMRPYRGFNELTMTSNIADVTYNALQVSASKRLRNGFAVDASYTLSRTKGQIENVGLYSFNWEDYTGYRLNTDRLHVAERQHDLRDAEAGRQAPLRQSRGTRNSRRLEDRAPLHGVQRHADHARGDRNQSGVQPAAGEYDDEPVAGGL